MTEDDDTGPEGGRTVAGRLVYDPRIATVDEATFNELVSLMRDGAPSKPPTPEALWRRAYRKAMFERRLVGIQPDLFGAKPITHMHRSKPGPVVDWQPEPVADKLARIARDPQATFGIGRPALSPEERRAVIDGAANWLRIAQRSVSSDRSPPMMDAPNVVSVARVSSGACAVRSLQTTPMSISIRSAQNVPRRSRWWNCVTSNQSETSRWSALPFPSNSGNEHDRARLARRTGKRGNDGLRWSAA